MPGRPPSREFRLEIVNEVDSGQQTTAQLSREHRLVPSVNRVTQTRERREGPWKSGLH